MRVCLRTNLGILGVFGALAFMHYPLLHLPYYWDEAGYYIPAALDFFHAGLLIPQSTLTTGHPPLVPVYLAMAWWLFEYVPVVTRLAMLLLAASAITALYALARRFASREVALWSTVLLALCPVFYAQSSLAHLDLTAGLFTTLAVIALLRHSPPAGPAFALAASLAVLSKETAVVLLPVAWAFAWIRRKERRATAWVWLLLPLLPLFAWTFYYHHTTGFWTGNREYLDYNLYSAIHPTRIFLSLLRRLYQLFVGGFHWLLVSSAAMGVWWTRRTAASRPAGPPAVNEERTTLQRDFTFLTTGLVTAYLLMLSVVGGAILRRYFLPILPVAILLAVVWLFRLPKRPARGLTLAVAVGFIGSWFINPPYPFPFEDNLAYADFVHLHQQAAHYLEKQPGPPRILTAWPATDEITHPSLGYVRQPLRQLPLQGFTPDDFRGVGANSFELLYLYSRKWEPPRNLLERVPLLAKLQSRYFDYSHQAPDDWLVARYSLRLVQQFERRGQWVRIYAKQK